jgi:uncharacterized protein YbaP (TraB family)
MTAFRRLLARLAAVLLVLLPALSPAREAATEPVRPALWKIADADTTIYLFGTVHVLPPGVDWFEGKVASAFASSQELVTELAQTDSAGAKSQMAASGALPPGQTLRGLLSDEERTRYEAALAGLGLPPQAFDGYEPWLAAMAISIAPLARAGFAANHGVDEALGEKAKARNLIHAGLETYDYQIGLFDSLPLETQKHYLAQVVKDLPHAQHDLLAMIEAWKRGDAEELARLMNAGEDYPGMVEMLLTNRNKAWASWVEERMKQPGTVFLAVGAGHLAGSGSLQEQLAAQGIVSERIQ